MKRQRKRISDRNFNDPKYVEWRQAVYARDGFRCRMPACNSKRGVLHAHHIKRWADHPTLRYVVSNGVTLCKDCHKKVTTNEEAYQSLLAGIVLNTGNKGKGADDFQLRLMLARYGKA